MAYSTFAPETLPINSQSVDVASVTAQFQRLSVDDKLALLWFAYTEMGRSITPAAPGAARLQFAEGLLDRVKAMSHDEQLGFMRDLIEKIDTPLTRSYGVLTANTKLAFWYRLSELMDEGIVIPVPANYQITRETNAALVAIQKLEFGQQITVLRNAVVDMGVDLLG